MIGMLHILLERRDLARRETGSRCALQGWLQQTRAKEICG